MSIVSDRRLLESLRRVHGKRRQVDFNLVSIVKNERFFLSAFLDHYRKIGVQQFIMVENGSDDGSLELLCAQPDVVVYQTSYRYGQEIEQRSRRFWRTNTIRAGIRL